MKKIRNGFPFIKRKLEKLWIMIRCVSFFMLLSILHVSGAVFSQGTISISLKNVTVGQVLDEIEQNSEFKFLYRNENIDVSRIINIDVRNADIETVLKEIFSDTDISFRLFENNLVAINIGKKIQQNISISGTVTDQSGSPLPGVTVIVKGTTQGAITDADGNYSLVRVPEDATLVFSFVGMKTQEIPIIGKTQINVTLAEDAIGIEEVVAIGYGTQKRVNLTGSISTVKNTSITNRAVSNLTTGLSGLVPGLNISQTSGGKVGSEGISISIRGIGTFNNNSPMVVVDGIVVGMNDIDPNDIESISVLKDAASAAIYGSRAANGVILISTKRGKAGEMKMSYTGYAGFQQVTTQPEFVNDFATYMELMNIYRGNELFYQEDIDEWRNSNNSLTHPNVDWYNEQVGRNAFMQNHNFSFSGGTEVTRYRFSLGYLDQDGLMPGNEQQRYSIRTNIETNMTKNLKVGGNIFFRWTELKPNPLNSGQGNGIIIGGTPAIPNIKSPDGRWGGTQHSATGTVTNVFAEIENAVRQNRSQHLVSDIFLDWEIVSGLTFKGNFSINFNNTLNRAFNKQFSTWNFREESLDRIINDPTSGTLDHTQGYRLTNYTTLNYSKNFGNHNFTILGGHQAESYRFENLTGGATNYPNNEIQVLSAGLENFSTGGIITEEAIESYFGRINYDFKGKYLFEANIRADGSSRFKEGNKWGYFPSTSLAWRISEEGFMSVLNFVNNLKLRASYGILGNQNINNYYPYQETYSINQNYSFEEQVSSGYASTALVNQNISWETTTMLSTAIEASLFKKITTSVEYFHKRTDDILAALPIPAFLGNKANPLVNLAEMVNKGIEASLNYKGEIGKVKVNAGAHVTYLKNKLTDYYEDIVTGGIQIGEAYNSYWGYESAGIIRTQEQLNNAATHWNYTGIGDLEYVDQITVDTNGDGIPDAGDGKIDNDDKVILGKPIPTWTFGGNLDFRYKNFDLSALFQGVAKVDGSWIGTGNRPFDWDDRGLLHSMWLDAYSEENPEGEFPRLAILSSDNNLIASSFWIRDISYLRIKNLQLGYTLPKSFINKLGLDKLRAYVSSDNLFMITNWDMGYDPETRSTMAMPNTKTFIFGVNIQF